MKCPEDRFKVKYVVFHMICSSTSELIVPGYYIRESLHDFKKMLDKFLEGKKKSTEGY